jgi:sugar/nucleoside kinase (ribokinase family)
MSLTVVGSIAFDSVRTPFGERDRMLGGSTVHFSLAASFFTEVRAVGPVGDDFGDAELKVLQDRGVITDDIERVEGGETFFWRAHYEYDMNVAHTDETQLNVFADFDPKLSDPSRKADLLFLGNIDPELQRRVRASCQAAFAALDSMNYWLEHERESLRTAISEVDCVMLNDAEIRELTGEPNLARGARAAMELGPGVVVAKRGEYGAALFTRDEFFAIPGYLLEDVRDPTGAGDCFAGGFLGYLDSRRAAGDSMFDPAVLRQAMAYGSVLASFNVEDFGTERIQGLSRDEIEERLRDFRRITNFEVDSAAAPASDAANS